MTVLANAPLVRFLAMVLFVLLFIMVLAIAAALLIWCCCRHISPAVKHASLDALRKDVKYTRMHDEANEAGRPSEASVSLPAEVATAAPASAPAPVPMTLMRQWLTERTVSTTTWVWTRAIEWDVGRETVPPRSPTRTPRTPRTPTAVKMSSQVNDGVEDIFEVSARNAHERRKVISERTWRKKLLDMGHSPETLLDDLNRRLVNFEGQTNEVRDRRREEEQRRIRRENAAHRERIAHMKTKIDDDTEDDATGVARARARAKSAARKQAEAQALRQANEERRARLRNVQAVTDDDVTDEAAGAARIAMAAASQAREEDEARQLAEENRIYRERMANVQAKTDDGDGLQS